MALSAALVKQVEEPGRLGDGRGGGGCFPYIDGWGRCWSGQVMSALFQSLVSAPTAARTRACRGVPRVVSWIRRSLASSWTSRMRLSSRSSRPGVSGLGRV